MKDVIGIGAQLTKTHSKGGAYSNGALIGKMALEGIITVFLF